MRSISVAPAPITSVSGDRDSPSGAALTVIVQAAFLPLKVLTVTVVLPTPTAVTRPDSLTSTTPAS